jgi:nicotinate-nucleotide pyrophosphorylase (carboxylating)
MDLNGLSLSDLYVRLVAPAVNEQWVRCVLEEDGADDDITTTSIVDPNRTADAGIVMRQGGVAAGLAAVPTILRVADASLNLEMEVVDGTSCQPDTVLARLSGALGSVLSSERLVLNLLGRLSGIATLTRAFVKAVDGTDALICDTRKTTPGLRALEKYAVRCGGGTLHRVNLSDAALFKDNHLATLPADQWVPRLTQAIRGVRARSPQFVQVEVDTLEQLRAVLGIGDGLIDVVMLDNMNLQELGQAVSMRNAGSPGVQLEASGGVTLGSVLAIAETGVDRISIGALTHGAPAIDVGLDVVRA